MPDVLVFLASGASSVDNRDSGQETDQATHPRPPCSSCSGRYRLGTASAGDQGRAEGGHAHPAPVDGGPARPGRDPAPAATPRRGTAPGRAEVTAGWPSHGRVRIPGGRWRGPEDRDGRRARTRAAWRRPVPPAACHQSACSTLLDQLKAACRQNTGRRRTGGRPLSCGKWSEAPASHSSLSEIRLLNLKRRASLQGVIGRRKFRRGLRPAPRSRGSR
jgi:hypothetical protein